MRLFRRPKTPSTAPKSKARIGAMPITSPVSFGFAKVEESATLLPSMEAKGMARRPTPVDRPQSANLSSETARAALPILQRRIDELASIDLSSLTEENCDNVLDGIKLKINATLREILGDHSIEFREYEVGDLRARQAVIGGGSLNALYSRLPRIRPRVSRTLSALETLRDLLKEKAATDAGSDGGRIIRAYEGLELHPEIARAASKRYLDGHYADAVEASVKALNGLVRIRSDLEFDGMTLMERVFNPTNPVLKFNALSTQSDKDEQKGFMMMFSGAVAGLRNPRAHEFIKDDPERALEFIAYVSLLAKLLDGAE
jgi:uncharacterized protein (TIGR02391 family)